MQLAGMTIGELAWQYNIQVPDTLNHHKGWLGDLMETVLGAYAGNLAQADFYELGVELKTLPLNDKGVPAESTFVCSIDMSHIHDLEWEHSTVYAKLQHVLFIPIHSLHETSIQDRCIATPLFWQPSAEDMQQLEQDWLELMELIQLGQFEHLDSRLGKFLQVRPKAANARVLTQVIDASGESCATLPRGFYLRPAFTRSIINNHFL